jgi:hypothetical protein
VKKTLLAIALMAMCTLAAVALKAKAPTTSQHLRGNPNEQFKMAPPGIPPALCSPCLFYGGDLDPNDQNAAGMSDENTLLIVGGSNTYGAITTPRSVTVSGILVNVQASTAFDPQTATYDIRSGITDGNGGSEIASGSGAIQVAATGRNFLGFNEFTVEVGVNPPVVLSPGTYWFSVQPQCTNTLDGSCSVGRIFVSNTTSGTNNMAGQAQPQNQMFFNSAFFGFNYANWCDPSLGFNSRQCGMLSFGLIGSGN